MLLAWGFTDIYWLLLSKDKLHHSYCVKLRATFFKIHIDNQDIFSFDLNQISHQGSLLDLLK